MRKISSSVRRSQLSGSGSLTLLSELLKIRQVRALRREKSVSAGHVFYMAPDDPNRDSFDPIIEPGWYHTDETQADVYGPFGTKEKALEELERYCEWLNQPHHA